VHPSADGTLKLLGGRAFRAPSVYEMTYQDGANTQKGAGALEPEIIYSAEVEYTHVLPAGFRLLGSVYLNHASNLIELRTDETDQLLVFRNVADPVWTLGGELELRKSFYKGSMLALQYSYQHTRLDEPFSARELPNSPAHLAGVKVIVPIFGRELRVASRVAVQSGRLDRDGDRTDAAVIWDVTLSGAVSALGMRYNAGVRNLLGWRYSHPVGDDVLDLTVQQPGLSLMMDVSFGI
jgi:outer membrane receptor protein involved in Fe transport